MAHLFCPVRDESEFTWRCQAFSKTARPPIPVWVGERRDLLDAVTLAETLYCRAAGPQQADVGVLLTDMAHEITESLLRPLAHTWVTLDELAAIEGPTSVLVVGLYHDLHWRVARPLLFQSQKQQFALGFLSGRDIHSLLWLVARQWAVVDPQVQAIGFFSAVDTPAPASPIQVYGERAMERENIQHILLDQPWRRVLLQGHGKDDSINLGNFTVCGRNEFVGSTTGTLLPRCAYGLSCYKDEKKLIPLRQVKAAELVLSACDSGPLAGLAMYDPKYVLLLNAIDGCAQTIVSAVNVHDSGTPENDLWLTQAARTDISAARILNRSLNMRHPYPVFWHFGLPLKELPPTRAVDESTADETIVRVVNRLHGYLVSDLLPQKHPFIPRLQKLNHKVNLYLTHDQLFENARSGGTQEASILTDLQSIDYTMAQHILTNPEDPVMAYDSYFMDRSILLPSTVQEVTCACGAPAQQFQHRGRVATIPTITRIVCTRCGDKALQLDHTPVLCCDAADRVCADQPLTAEITVTGQERGPVQVGIFVPLYLRPYTRIEPALKKVKISSPGERRSLMVTISFAAGVPPHAYYVKVFAIQNLGISIYRHRFGITGPTREGRESIC